jgi:CRISPR/Cas system-associated protein Cas10 (large subunit of type III CRISPR-Cas system)
MTEILLKVALNNITLTRKLKNIKTLFLLIYEAYYHKTIIKSMLAPKRPSSTLNHPKLKPTVLELDVVADIFCMLFF